MENCCVLFWTHIFWSNPAERHSLVNTKAKALPHLITFHFSQADPWICGHRGHAATTCGIRQTPKTKLFQWEVQLLRNHLLWDLTKSLILMLLQQVLQILWAPVEGRQQLWLCELQKRIWLPWKQWIKSLTGWKTQGLLIKLLHHLVWGKGKIWPYSALSIVTKKSPCGPKVFSWSDS